MSSVLVLATTTGYQTRAFGEAARRLGVELVFATDRCHLIEDPWQDRAIPIRFYDEDASVRAIIEAARAHPIDGIIVVGDRPTVIAALVAQHIGVPFHSPRAAAIARHKQRTRETLRDAGLPVPWWIPMSLSEQLALSAEPRYPCVLKPVSLSGSRGVMRIDDPASLGVAVDRLRAIVRSPDVRAERNDAHDEALIEAFIPGREYAVEGLMHDGALDVLAVFDKPDPLNGPFFEETIYVTPSATSDESHGAIVAAVGSAAAAIGLSHGPIHAECRVNPDGVFVLEVGARPIGGLCARALRFTRRRESGVGNRDSRIGLDVEDASNRATNPESPITLEELLLRHALGENPGRYEREPEASGVMMIPIPRRGILRGIHNLDDARRVPHVVDVQITAKIDQRLVPLPEGASYLGFIFARAAEATAVEHALRAAHAHLVFAIDAEFPIVAPPRMDYNLQHG